jgi:anti-sigma factor (TIGR02949 family)
MYSCEQVMAELTNYLDDPASSHLREEIEKHLAHCATCRVLYDSTKKTLKIVTEARSFEIPSDLSKKITERIMEQVRKRTPRQDPGDRD